MSDIKTKLRNIKSKNFYVALTGGIGSGKSTVLKKLGELGVGTISADLISRQLISTKGAAVDLIREKFGAKIITNDCSVDRKKLREIVFENPNLLIQLEEITHPLIWNEIVFQLEKLNSLSPPPYIAIEIPVPKNTRIWSDFFDLKICVLCKEEIRRNRILERGGLSEAEADLIIKSQNLQYAYEAMCDIILDNSSVGLSLLDHKILKLNQKILTFKK
jgi:dephospho-CoA kinase